MPRSEFEPYLPHLERIQDILTNPIPFVVRGPGYYVHGEIDGEHVSFRADFTSFIKGWVNENMRFQEMGLHVSIVQFRNDPENKVGVFIQYDQILGQRRVAHVSLSSVKEMLAQVKATEVKP
jgi:hypothetical protein